MIGQGQIWWLEQPHEKGRPCLVLTRDRTIPVLTHVMVAPLTTRIRGLKTEVELGAADGVPRLSVVNLQHTASVSKGYLVRQLGELARGRWHEVCTAMRVAISC